MGARSPALAALFAVNSRALATQTELEDRRERGEAADDLRAS
jgi:hypothetical protein